MGSQKNALAMNAECGEGEKTELIDLGTEHPLSMSYRPGKSRNLVVVFSGVGTDPKCYPSVEFFASTTRNGRNHVIFVSDFSRSWLNAPGIDEQIIGMVESVFAAKRLESMSLVGNSMGGTMALMLADRLPAKTVLCFCPQFSVDPRIVPEEKRWRRYRKNIERFRFSAVSPLARPNRTIYIVHGGTSGELMHASRFPRVPGVRHFIIPRYGHNLARNLNEKRQLAPLVAAALEDRPFRFRKLIEKQGGTLLKDYNGSHSA